MFQLIDQFLDVLGMVLVEHGAQRSAGTTLLSHEQPIGVEGGMMACWRNHSSRCATRLSSHTECSFHARKPRITSSATHALHGTTDAHGSIFTPGPKPVNRRNALSLQTCTRTICFFFLSATQVELSITPHSTSGTPLSSPARKTGTDRGGGL